MENLSSSIAQLTPRFVLAIILGLAGVLILWIAAKSGFSRFLGKYALIAADLAVAERATSMSPSDPETHRINAAVFYKLKGLPQAAEELQLAISLRPRDD